MFFGSLKYQGHHQWRLIFTAMEKARKAAYPSSKADIELRSCRSSRGNNNDDAGPLSLGLFYDQLIIMLILNFILLLYT